MGDLNYERWWNNIRKCGEMSYVLPQGTIDQLWEKVTLEKCDILQEYWGGYFIQDKIEWPFYAKG